MKTILTAVFIFVSSFLNAQKKYDCIVLTKNHGDMLEHRFVSTLFSFRDSSIYLITTEKDTALNWQEIEAIKFRKHNGFSKTVLPVSVFTSFVATELLITRYPPPASLVPLITIIGTTIYSVFVTVPIGTIIYFITRNHAYTINSYDDFQKLKQASTKYIYK